MKIQRIKTRKYGLWHLKKKCLLTFYTHSNEGGYACCSAQHLLDTDQDYPQWLTDDPQHAAWVRFNSTEWYNAGFETPTHDFESFELAVVAVEVETILTPLRPRLPTPKQYFCAKYARSNPGHLKYILETHKDHELSYCWHEFCLFRSEQQRKKGSQK